jgi:predicted RNA-binding Zn-ribbon protein involved in translation (DUF1610 family)
MAPLSFTCPNTGRQSLTRVETDTASLATAWKKTLRIECPHCGEVHRVAVREAYIASAFKMAPYRSWPTASLIRLHGQLPRDFSRAGQKRPRGCPDPAFQAARKAAAKT